MVNILMNIYITMNKNAYKKIKPIGIIRPKKKKDLKTFLMKNNQPIWL